MQFNVLTTLSSLIFAVNMLLAVAVIFLERRNVGATWAWVMVLFLLPGVGFVVYMLLGQNLSQRKIYKLTVEHVKVFQAALAKQREELPLLLFTDAESSVYRDLVHMNLMSGKSLYTQDNTVQIYTEGSAKFAALEAAIEAAVHHIHLLYYIWRNDQLGRKLVHLLSAKARAGVYVRVLVDDVGSSALPREYWRELRDAGGMVAAFFPSRVPYLNMRVNYRNHRKLAIIDGKTGFIGGFNVGDEYLGLNKRFGFWRDTHLQVEGSAVLQMQARFMLDWTLTSDKQLLRDEAYFPEAAHEGTIGMQVLASGPNDAEEQIRNAYIKLINSAKRNVLIQTPYFIPDESMFTALKMAALSGVDVQIMLPSKPDRKLVYWASISYLDELLEAGVTCHLYEKGFLHAKTIVVDGQAASVGTANVDIRSFKLNFEVNAFLFDKQTAMELERIFTADLQHCRRLTLAVYKERPLSQRFMESCARLLSPIL